MKDRLFLKIVLTVIVFGILTSLAFISRPGRKKKNHSASVGKITEHWKSTMDEMSRILSQNLVLEGISYLKEKEYKRAYSCFINAKDYENALKCANEGYASDSLWSKSSAEEAQFLLMNSVRDIDGNVYKTIKIGKQVWMAENLGVNHYRNGDEISSIRSCTQIREARDFSIFESIVEPHEMFSIPMVTSIEKRYQWYSLKDPRGLAPAGWHPATFKDWDILINYAGGYENAAKYLRVPIEEVKDSIDRQEPAKYFSFCRYDGRYYYDFWIAPSERDTIGAKVLSMTSPNPNVSIFGASKDNFIAVRCVKD